MIEDDWNFDYPKIARDSGFKFHQYNEGNIDWRQIGGIEVEKILQNQNIEKLDTIIIHLAEVPLSPLLNSNILESGITKYFILSQLAIQYLIFCKRFLDETVTSMRNTLKELQSENIRYKKLEQEHTDDVLQLHKELQKLRNISEVVFPCSMCTKNFVSNEMLNVHISRKHSTEMQRCNNNNNNVEKRTEKENDKQLISAIKLELEIKHLKERLNEAEKVIRTQTFEISKQIEEIKLSPRLAQPQIQKMEEKLAKTVAIQNEIVSTKNIGIQSNLVEDKEKDDTDTMEKNNILEIFKKINEKINQIEKVRDDDLKSREETLQKFENKLQDVTEAIEAKQQHNLEILNKFTDKMSSQTSLNQEPNLDELKDFLNNAMEKIQNENKKQLHQMVEKFDQAYVDKLNALDTKIEKVNETEIIPKESLVDLKTIINKNKELAQKLSGRHEIEKKIPLNSDITKILQPIKPERRIPKPVISVTQYVTKKVETSRSESSQSSETSETETESSDSTSYSDDKKDIIIDKTKTEHTSRSGTGSIKSSPKDIKGSNISSKTKMPTKFKETSKNIVPPLKLKPSSYNIPKIVRKMQENRFNSVGLSPKTKSITTSSMPEINKNLANIRRAQKRLFPKFNATRSHLKAIVDKMIGSRTVRKNLKKQPEKSVPVASAPRRIVFKKIDSENEDSILSKSSDDSENPIENQESVPSTSTQAKDDFKSKLERILSSPIHKLKKVSSVDSSTSKTPVPTPRKKVMFDFDKKKDKDDDSSILSDVEENKEGETKT